MKTTNKTLPLFPEIKKSVPVKVLPPAESGPSFKSAKSLWLCLDFTQLPLDIFPKKCLQTTALAVVEEQHGGQRIVACSQAAKNAGIYTGLPLNAALALVPDLQTLPRNISQEEKTLKRLAGWAGQFTSQVSIGDDHSLWLEVGKSLRLFGGVAPLRQLIRKGLSELNVSAKVAVAPTPLASLWLARAGHDVIIREYHELPGQLGKLPLSILRWSKEVHERLQRMGVQTLAEFMRLPRSGIARRFGKDSLAQIDRALGRSPDFKAVFEPDSYFDAHLDLPCEMTSQKLLVFGIERLVNELGGFLISRQGGIQNLSVKFHHLEKETTEIKLGLLGVSRNSKKLISLIEERMENTEFPEPVIALSIRSGKVRRLDPDNESLFPQMEDKKISPELIDRIRARLGSNAVSGVCIVPEYRPEKAWSFSEPGAESTLEKGPNNRPLWLLQEPIELEIHRKTPHFEGILSLTSRPERIETGWWDGLDICRDYYSAKNPGGKRLWIYRDRRQRGKWFLHGIFG